MEPMTLGSPNGSPGANSNYLPPFFMGGIDTVAPRKNTLSPIKANGSRNFPFANSPTSPQNYGRSVLSPRSPYRNNDSGHTQHSISMSNYPGTPLRNVNSGPPTQGLFDTLQQEINMAEAAKRAKRNRRAKLNGTPMQAYNVSGFGSNQSYQQPYQYNDYSYLSNGSYNAPIITGLNSPSCSYNSALMQCQFTPEHASNWVTVYGFPPSATTAILHHFSQCGAIVEKVFPPQNGNWVHIRYASRLECDRALSYNDKVLNGNLMIGVTRCKDNNIIECEDLREPYSQSPTIRPVTQTAYTSEQDASVHMGGLSAPQKTSSSLMHKAMDLIFGW